MNINIKLLKLVDQPQPKKIKKIKKEQKRAWNTKR